MKNIIICLFFITLSSCKSHMGISSDENKKEDILLFNRGQAIFETLEETSIDHQIKNIDTLTKQGKVIYEALYDTKEDILYFALEQFEAVVNNHPNSKLYPKALYNLAYINNLLEFDLEEIRYLKMILDSNANDKDPSGRRGLMANPYANYKHEASNRLTEIYIKKGEYKTALAYKKTNDNYPLQHFCGNAYAANDLYNAKQYAEIYIGLGEPKKALSFLLPHIFNNGLANNSDLVALTVSLLKSNNNDSFLKKEFEKSINAFYTKTTKENDNEWGNYFIKYLGVEIEIPSWNLWFESDSKKIKTEIEKIIHESAFYIALNE